MKVSARLLTIVVALGVTCFCIPAEASFITIDELSDLPPIITTDLEAAVITTGFEFGTVTGLLRPATSPSPLVPGTYFATLLGPVGDPFGPRISDILRLIVGQVETDQGGLFQRETLAFFSDGAPGFDSIIPAGLVPPSVLETGEFQDVTTLLRIGFPDQNLRVSVRSDLASLEPVPEPGTLSLIALGLLGLGRGLRKRASGAGTSI